MKKFLLSLMVLAGLSLYAANTPASYGKCISCHGANGEKVALGKSKKLQEMTKEDIVKALNGYKDGIYGGVMKGIMLGQVKTLSDKDIEDIAVYLGKK